MSVETGLRPRQMVLAIGVAVLAGIVVVSAIRRLAGFSDIRDTLRGANASWLVLCAVGQVLVFAGYAGVFRRALAVGGGATLPVDASVRLALASFAATQLFAFGGVGGLAVVYWALRRVGRDRDEAAVLLIGLNTSVYLVFAVIGWTSAGLALTTGIAPLAMTVPWLVGVPIVLVAARWFIAPARLGRWSTTGAGGLRLALATGIGAAAWTRDRLGDRDGRRMLAWAVCYWAGDLLSLGAALRAFGAEPGPIALAVAYTTGYLVQSLPIPLIATAGVDTATTLLLHVVGVPIDVALLGVVAHRLFAFWLPIVPGSLFAITLPRVGALDAENSGSLPATRSTSSTPPTPSTRSTAGDPVDPSDPSEPGEPGGQR